jgi:amino acid transporter
VLIQNLAPTGKGIFGAVGLSTVLLGISIAFLGFNGYDAALNLAEDTKGTRRVVGLGALRAALVAIVLESLAVAAILIGAPSLKGLMTSSDPISYFGSAVFSSGGFKVIDIAVVIALVNATLAIVLQFSRILYASGRDKIWPGYLSDGLAWISPRLKTPVIALGVMFVASLMLVIFSNLIATITFNVAALLGIYVLVVISALVSRVRDRRAERPYRMPVWPLLVVIALAGSVAALIKQTGHDLLILGIWIAAGTIYFAVFLRGKRTWGLPVAATLHSPQKTMKKRREER